MKIPRISLIEIALGLSAAGLAVLAVVMVTERIQPPALRFQSLEVVNSPVPTNELLYVVAETVRRDMDGCTNGVQVDVRDLGGAVTRLPVPAREIDGNVSRYALVIPEGTRPGPYQLVVRESWYCGGKGPKVVETPWVPFMVAPHA